MFVIVLIKAHFILIICFQFQEFMFQFGVLFMRKMYAKTALQQISHIHHMHVKIAYYMHVKVNFCVSIPRVSVFIWCTIYTHFHETGLSMMLISSFVHQLFLSDVKACR